MPLTMSKSREVRDRIDKAKEHFVMVANCVRNIEVALSEKGPLTDSAAQNLKRLRHQAEYQYRQMTKQLGLASLLGNATSDEDPS